MSPQRVAFMKIAIKSRGSRGQVVADQIFLAATGLVSQTKGEPTLKFRNQVEFEGKSRWEIDIWRVQLHTSSGGGDRATLMAKSNIFSDFLDIFSETNAFSRPFCSLHDPNHRFTYVSAEALDCWPRTTEACRNVPGVRLRLFETGLSTRCGAEAWSSGYTTECPLGHISGIRLRTHLEHFQKFGPMCMPFP